MRLATVPQRFVVFALALLLCAASPAQNDSLAPVRLALKGYDPVAYFTQGKPVKGTPRLSYDWDQGRYHFSSPKHRDAFAANPERYAPQFAGICTAGVSVGKKVEANPELWAIVNGKLYLFSSLEAKESVEKDPKALAVAQKQWRKVNR